MWVLHFWIWRRVASYTLTDISEEYIASIFNLAACCLLAWLLLDPEDGGSTFLRNVVNNLAARCHIPEHNTLQIKYASSESRRIPDRREVVACIKLCLWKNDGWGKSECSERCSRLEEALLCNWTRGGNWVCSQLWRPLMTILLFLIRANCVCLW
jgi:hypothetical protein